MSPRKAALALALGVLAASISAQAAAPGAAPTRAGGARSSRGLGTDHMAVTTHTSRRRRRFFDQGLRLLYAFNHQEARRAFREAARLDPALAMAYWGEAMTLAPNLNAPMTAENARLARAAILEAQRRSRAARAPTRARADRRAGDALRRGSGAAPRPPLDRAYADAMAQVGRRVSATIPTCRRSTPTP